MMARSKTLQSKAGYIDARPLTTNSTKLSCDARPDHTLGHKPTSRRVRAVSASPPTADINDLRRRVRFGPGADVRIAATTFCSPCLRRPPASETKDTSRPRIRCDLVRNMFGVFADAEQKCRLPFVQPRQAQKIHTRDARNPPLVAGRSTRQLGRSRISGDRSS